MDLFLDKDYCIPHEFDIESRIPKAMHLVYTILNENYKR